MGKKLTLYIRDEVVDRLDAEDNKSELINNLLCEYYSDDLEVIKVKLLANKKEREILEMKLKKNHTKVKAKEEVEKKKEEEELIKDQREALLNKVGDLWRAGAIDDGHYFSCFDKKGKFIEEKGKLYIEELNKGGQDGKGS